MTEKELCKMCTEYSVDVPCEEKEKCPLLKILRENKKLKQEIKELKSISNWEKFPDEMGK